MIQKLAVIDYLASGRVAEAIVTGLGSEAVFFCGSDYVNKAPQAIERMKKAGVEVVIDNYGQAVLYTYFLADSARRLNLDPNTDPGQKILKMDKRGARFVYYTHHSGFSIPGALFGKNDFILCPSEAFLTASVLAGKYILGADRRPIMGKTPQGSECVVVGMPNVGDDILALASGDKRNLQAELAARLGLSLDPGLPLVFFLVERHAEKDEMENVCRVLAEKFNVLIKNLGPANPDTGDTELDLTGPNIFYFNPPPNEDAELFYKLRVAADFTFTSFFSGGTVTNVMMGLRTVSYHTSTLVRDTPPKRYNWTYFMRDFGWLTPHCHTGWPPSRWPRPKWFCAV